MSAVVNRGAATEASGGTYLKNGQSLSQDPSQGDRALTTHQAVAKVDHLNVPQVPQSLKT